MRSLNLSSLDSELLSRMVGNLINENVKSYDNKGRVNGNKFVYFNDRSYRWDDKILTYNMIKEALLVKESDPRFTDEYKVLKRAFWNSFQTGNIQRYKEFLSETFGFNILQEVILKIF